MSNNISTEIYSKAKEFSTKFNSSTEVAIILAAGHGKEKVERRKPNPHAYLAGSQPTGEHIERLNRAEAKGAQHRCIQPAYPQTTHDHHDA